MQCVPIVHPKVGPARDMARKDAALKIRIEKLLRQEFLAACQANDLSAAQVLRSYMREYVTNHRASSQGNLFEMQPSSGQNRL